MARKNGKRKNDKASKQKAKRQKRLDEAAVAQADYNQAAVAQADDNQAEEDHPFDFSKLPPEIWLDIMDYLKPADKCMRYLAATCKELHKICSPRLNVLKLYFGKTKHFMNCPVIKRAYTDIRIDTTSFIDCNIKNLKPSRETARKLSITFTYHPPYNDYENEHRFSRLQCEMKINTLLLILGCLPNLEEVTLQNVVCFRPKQGKNKDKLPKLSKLKKLTIENVSPLACSAFAEAENIEELKVKLGFSNKYTSDVYGQLVAKQKNLKLLHSNITLPQRFEDTLHLIDVTVGGNDFENIFKNHPKLEHFKHKPGSQLSSETLTAGPPVTSLKTLEIWRVDLNKDDYEPFSDEDEDEDPADNEVVYNINEIRQKFPSLESFQSYRTRLQIREK